MGTNLKQFTRQVRSTQLLDEELVKFHKKIVIDLFSSIVQKTPVDTGLARNNWQINVGQPTDKILEAAQSDPFNKLAALKPYGVVYIVNNVAYIIYLEDGTSQQAPTGMVAVALEEFGLE